jgi:hypothetical protein
VIPLSFITLRARDIAETLTLLKAVERHVT